MAPQAQNWLAGHSLGELVALYVTDPVFLTFATLPCGDSRCRQHLCAAAAVWAMTADEIGFWNRQRTGERRWPAATGWLIVQRHSAAQVW